jgi:hypothetical protein
VAPRHRVLGDFCLMSSNSVTNSNFHEFCAFSVYEVIHDAISQYPCISVYALYQQSGKTLRIPHILRIRQISFCIFSVWAHFISRIFSICEISFCIFSVYLHFTPRIFSMCKTFCFAYSERAKRYYFLQQLLKKFTNFGWTYILDPKPTRNKIWYICSLKK